LNSGFLYKQQLVRFALFGSNGSFIKSGLDPQEETLKKVGFKKSVEWGSEPKEQWGTLNTRLNGLNFNGKIVTETGCYEKYFENIYEAITNHKQLLVKPEQVLVTSRIIELALKSSAEKKVIKYSD
jgi:predicted dehydrogenase